MSFSIIHSTESLQSLAMVAAAEYRDGLGFFVKMPDSEAHQRVHFTKLSLGIWVFKVCGSESSFFQTIKKENTFFFLL